MKAMHWREEEVFLDGDSFFESLEGGIARARHSIELETYIFENDALGLKIISALKRAVERGVRVRVSVDGFGSRRWLTTIVPLLNRAGCETRIYHPLPWTLLGKPFRDFDLKWLGKMNRRNHRKLCVVDEGQAWTGSMNFSARHLRSAVGRVASRDTAIRVAGSGVKELHAAFYATWNKSWYPRWFQIGVKSKASHSPHFSPHKMTSDPVRLNSTRALRRASYSDLIHKITEAKARIWVTNAYFAPVWSLLYHLRAAAARGVDVRLLVPRKSDQFFMPWITRTYYYTLLLAGVQLFEYLPSFLHAKTLFIDDWAIVGSSNLNHRSLIYDLEVDIVVESDASKNTLSQQFELDLRHSKQFTLNDWQHQSLFHRILGRLAELFRDRV